MKNVLMVLSFLMFSFSFQSFSQTKENAIFQKLSGFSAGDKFNGPDLFDGQITTRLEVRKWDNNRHYYVVFYKNVSNQAFRGGGRFTQNKPNSKTTTLFSINLRPGQEASAAEYAPANLKQMYLLVHKYER